jgi:hypothetical protein
MLEVLVACEEQELELQEVVQGLAVRGALDFLAVSSALLD